MVSLGHTLAEQGSGTLMTSLYKEYAQSWPRTLDRINNELHSDKEEEEEEVDGHFMIKHVPDPLQ